ncbi:MAG: CPBP family intramembrane metalloprotease [Planctomycetes bacterium]|nr:CPBP family intramembrane metalloprotease [Planctomycetota bacterium]
MIDPAFEPRPWDFALVALLVGVLPLWTALVAIPKIRALPAAEQDRIRPRFYIEAMLLQWGMGMVALSPLLFRGVGPVELGLLPPPGSLPGTALGGGLVLALLLVMARQRNEILRRPDGPALVRESIARFEWIFPRTRVQRRLWVGVSLHAGVFEELFFRGYLLALLNWHMPLWAAAALATLLFGLGHAYQGLRGVFSTAVIGAVLMGLYLLTGSLWVSVIAHAVYDIHGGEFGRRALYGQNADG